MFNGNYTSIIHHFRDIEVFLLAGNDVIAISPLWRAVGDLSSRILKERPQLSILVALIFFVFLEPFTSYSTLFIWLGFKHLGLFGVVFRGYHPTIVV